jgi:hypothetical protein
MRIIIKPLLLWLLPLTLFAGGGDRPKFEKAWKNNDVATLKLFSGNSLSRKDSFKAVPGLEVAVNESINKALSLNSDSDLINNVHENHFFIILTPKQVLFEVEGGKITMHAISAARAGFGNGASSGQTSTGFMRIFGTVNRGGAKNQYIFSRHDVRDYVYPQVEDCGGATMTSRLLMLQGLESKNINVFNRGVYLHGTNKEAYLGQPASHGCIRMDNDTVVNLCDSKLRSIPDYEAGDFGKIVSLMESKGYLLYVK